MSNIKTSCPHCGAHFGGRAAHCPTCHHTFSSDSGFDRHLISKVTAGCHDPAALVDKHEPPRPVFAWNEDRQLWQLAFYGERPASWGAKDGTTQ